MGQSSTANAYVPNIIPPSPNAATLMKFTDVPVSPYTGTANVNVPIYSIQLKGMTLPISLDYHTGGIRLKEESGWVGLGWALNAGGMISRTILGHDDFNSGWNYFSSLAPQIPGDVILPQPSPASDAPNLGPLVYDFFCSYLVHTNNGNMDFHSAFTQGTDLVDMEPDIFNYNFPGHAGRFILTRQGKAVLQKQENILINFPTTGASCSIIDEQGNRYYFNDHDQTQQGGGQPMTSNWYLTKIVTQQGDSAIFTYVGGNSSSNTKSDISESVMVNCGPNQNILQSYQPSPTYYNEKLLQSIDFPNGRILFKFNENRRDLQFGDKLDSVILYTRATDGSLKYLKQFNLSYSYFNTDYPSGSDSLEFLRLRLDSVKEVSGNSSIPPYAFVYNQPATQKGIAKHSFSIDHWGYYNGVANSTFIPTINTFYGPPGYPSPTYYTRAGAIRLPSEGSMEAWSLQQVKYPTGGKTIFAYEANDYDNQLSTNGPTDFKYATLFNVDSTFPVSAHGYTNHTVDLTQIQPILPTGSPQRNLTIHVTFRYLNNGDSTYKNSLGKIYFNFWGPNVNLNQDISGITGTGNSPAYVADIPVLIAPVGTFNWQVYIDPSVDTIHHFAEVDLNFQYEVSQNDYNLMANGSQICPASGLRIHSVTDYSDAGTVAGMRVYNYGYKQDKLGKGTPQSYSYGRLMAFPSYQRYSPISTNTGGVCIGMELFGSSNNSLTSVIQGNIVGYDQVTETRIDPVTGNDIGKTVYTYFNSADSAVSYGGYRFPGAFNVGNSLNGSLLSKVTYALGADRSYYKVAETDNQYRTDNRSIYYSAKYQYPPQSSGLDGTKCTTGTAVERETIACFYPSIKSERVLLVSNVEKLFQQNGGSNAVVKTSNLYYDNAAHFQVTRSHTVDSKGNTLVSFTKYPQDYLIDGNNATGNGMLDSLLAHNMVASTIEHTDSLYYAGSGSAVVTGAQLNLYRSISSTGNPVMADRIYKLDIAGPTTSFQPFSFSGNTVSQDSRYSQKISFDQYDGFTNIAQYTPINQSPQSFIWDYRGQLPIAKVAGATLSQVAYTSFEADGTGNWSVPSGTRDTAAMTGSQSYNLGNGAVTHSGLSTASTYVVSYWSKTGASYSVTGSASVVQGKTIRGWTYFEHTVKGTAAVTVSGGGDIDELRLYPATAQMTTYTYNPEVGISSQCDVGNRITYYFYDGLSRLKYVKDQDGNIIKTIEYHYTTP